MKGGRGIGVLLQHVSLWMCVCEREKQNVADRGSQREESCLFPISASQRCCCCCCGVCWKACLSQCVCVESEEELQYFSHDAQFLLSSLLPLFHPSCIPPPLFLLFVAPSQAMTGS